MRIAGARLAGRPFWPLSSLAAELDDELVRLDRLTAGDLAVRAPMALSYRALDEPAQRLFRLLGVFDLPDFPAWLAAAVLGVALDEATVLLHRLADAQLLSPAGPGRHRMHDLVRLYARERASVEDGAERARTVLSQGFGAYLALAERMAEHVPGPCYAALHGSAPRVEIPGLSGPDDALDWFETERSALVAAARQAADADLTEVAYGIAGCLEKYFDIRGIYVDWQATNEYVLEACRAAGNLLGQAVMLRGLIEVRTWHSAGSADPAMDRMYADASGVAELFAKAGEDRGRADATVDLAWALAARGDYEQAFASATEALTVAGRHGHLGGEARAHVALAVINAESLQVAEAFDHLSQALHCARRLGNVRYEATVLQFLGIAYTRIGDVDAAEPVLEQSLAILRRYHDGYAEVLTLLALARVHLLRRSPRARPVASEALAVAEELTLPHHVADALGVLGEIDLIEGRHHDAVEHLEASVRLWRTRGWPAFLAAVLVNLGHAHAATESLAARRAWTEARDIYAQLGQRTKVDELEALLH